MSNRSKTKVGGMALAVVCMFVLFLAASASGASDKLLFAFQFGREVNLSQAGKGSALEDICTAGSGDVCRTGAKSAIGGGFTFPASVAVDPATKTVYVADYINDRVQELTAGGAFVSMFGWNVNKTKIEKGAPQADRNVCTAASGDECQAGEAGTGLAEQMSGPQDLAVDPTTHDVYVGDLFYKRIDVYTAQGAFVLVIGGNVDKTKVDENGSTEAERNVCTAASKDECQAGAFAPSALKGYLSQESGNLLTFGPEGVLYVGEEERIQKFEATGKYKGEIALASLGAEGTVKGLAVDQAGKIYLSYSYPDPETARQVGGAAIHEYESDGKEVAQCATPNQIVALAVDPFGRIAVTEAEASHGVLYTAACGELGVFGPPEGMQGAHGMAFSGSEAGLELYVADAGRQDVENYALAPIVAVKTTPPPVSCTEGLEEETSVAFDCTVEGEADPDGVGGTTVWFDYGLSPTLGAKTPAQNLATGSGFVPFNAVVDGLRPNEKYYYRAASEDDNSGGEPVTGSILAFTSPSVPPKTVCGTPESFFVTFSSAVLLCGVNPENASTTYRFQYGACAHLTGCASVSETEPLESREYGQIGMKQTAVGLQPGTTYSYRVVAVNEHAEEATGSEATFTTLPAPHPTAGTEAASGVSATGATLNGVVNPDGPSATYALQAGVYEGASTVYSTVVQGATGSGSVPVHESYTVTGLQPGTTYAYRIAISGAYVQSAANTLYGEPVLFTTAGLPSVLFAPAPEAMLAIPSIAFPGPAVAPKTVVKKTAPKKKKTKKTKSKKTKKARKGANASGGMGGGHRHGKGARHGSN
jgi:hypothetical protein